MDTHTDVRPSVRTMQRKPTSIPKKLAAILLDESVPSIELSIGRLEGVHISARIVRMYCKWCTTGTEKTSMNWKSKIKLSRLRYKNLYASTTFAYFSEWLNSIADIFGTFYLYNRYNVLHSVLCKTPDLPCMSNSDFHNVRTLTARIYWRRSM